MNPEKHSYASFQIWFGILGCLLLLISAGGALSISWLRQEGSRTAARCMDLEQKIADQRRENANLAAQLAQVHAPQYLIENAPRGLRPTTEDQVVFMRLRDRGEIDALRKMEPSSSEDEDVEPNRTPLSVAFDYALLGTTD